MRLPMSVRARSTTALAQQRRLAAGAGGQLAFRVLINAHEHTTSGLRATLDSLVRQAWINWQALVIGTESAVDTTELAGVPAHRVHLLRGNDQSTLLNESMSRGLPRDFLLFLESGDRLEPDCLYEIAAVASRDPLIDLVHWDDDVIDRLGMPSAPRYRPGWSPDMLLSANYIGRAFAMRARRFNDAGALHDGLDDAARWDLLLRAGLSHDSVSRIPRVLSHVRDRAPAAPDAARQLVGDHLRRMAWPASAALRGRAVVVEWDLEKWPRATLIIPTRHNRALVGPLLRGLERTDYPSFDVVIMDNGPCTAENQGWYDAVERPFPVRVEWWTQEFNYSAVNNAAARGASGEVLVFLNDDIELLDARWLRDLVGWATRPQIGIAGLQLLDARGNIQHGGVIVGLNGFADHLFQGVRPGEDTLLGSTDWYRNVLAVTGACLAIRREVFADLGGFDEQLRLCGNDVALGLTAHIAGLRTVCSAAARVRHYESATRGTSPIPIGDFHASYWRYQPWLHGGDPYFSPELSLRSSRPRRRRRREPTALEMVSPVLGRSFTVYRQSHDLELVPRLAATCQAAPADVEPVRSVHRRNRGRKPPQTVNWFIPDLDSPFYGGINTAFRIADFLQRRHGVINRFVVTTLGPEVFIRSGIAAAFPQLAESPIVLLNSDDDVDLAPAADAAIATLWTTAYQVARFSGAPRKFYLIQDFEPMFYAASSMYALAEESYRLGLYGICNTENLLRIYRQRYGGEGVAFMPAVDPRVFHARGRKERTDGPVTLFVYARPGHMRNCWELAYPTLNALKDRLGDRIRILAAGSWAIPADPDHLPAITYLGLLDYRATGALYRRCDMGLTLTVSEHPSYLPLELMACGAPVVAFDNPAGYWLLRDEENSLLTPRTVDGLLAGLERLAVNSALRRRLAQNALGLIAERHADWDVALRGIFDFIADPQTTLDVASIYGRDGGGTPAAQLSSTMA